MGLKSLVVGLAVSTATFGALYYIHNEIRDYEPIIRLALELPLGLAGSAILGTTIGRNLIYSNKRKDNDLRS